MGLRIGWLARANALVSAQGRERESAKQQIACLTHDFVVFT